MTINEFAARLNQELVLLHQWRLDGGELKSVGNNPTIVIRPGMGGADHKVTYAQRSLTLNYVLLPNAVPTWQALQARAKRDDEQDFINNFPWPNGAR